MHYTNYTVYTTFQILAVLGFIIIGLLIYLRRNSVSVDYGKIALLSGVIALVITGLSCLFYSEVRYGKMGQADTILRGFPKYVYSWQEEGGNLFIHYQNGIENLGLYFAVVFMLALIYRAVSG